jgi:hypothetical protein
VSFVENAMHLQRLARAAMLYSSDQQWKCFPSPLFVGDRALSVPLPIISNALLATSTVELTATLNLAMRDGFAAEGWAKSRIAGALEYAAQMQRATLEAVIELFQLDVCAARYADAVPGSATESVTACHARAVACSAEEQFCSVARCAESSRTIVRAGCECAMLDGSE